MEDVKEFFNHEVDLLIDKDKGNVGNNLKFIKEKYEEKLFKLLHEIKENQEMFYKNHKYKKNILKETCDNDYRNNNISHGDIINEKEEKIDEEDDNIKINHNNDISIYII